MQIDLNRIRVILQGQHNDYGWSELPIPKDYRWIPTRQNLIAPHNTNAAG